MKVLILEPVFAHYRKDFYHYCLNNKTFEFTLMAGKNYKGIKGIEIEDARFCELEYLKFTIFSHEFFYLKGALKLIKKESPDAIFCSGVDFHLIHTIFIYFYHFIFKRKPFIWWSHAGSGKQGKFGSLLRGILYKYSSGAAVYSEKGKNNLIKSGVKKDSIAIIKNAINEKDYGFLKYDLTHYKKHHNELSILFCGRITADKKLELLIRAINIIKSKYFIPIKLVIVGGGDIINLKKIINELDIHENIEFAGAKYERDLPSYYMNSDLFVYPGGIGLSIVQALSYGLPVITSDNIKIHGPEIELLIKEKNGDFFKDNCPESLAGKIIEWKDKISNSAENEIMKNCVNSVKESEYLPQNVSKRLIHFLEKRLL